ncbi:BRCT domain-containing protein [Quillaja saponaria]|uniref:BRCT domain-containing protein n=1 Tax=Quillaja saponaria TaxID=32244 RepID=A0AAD7L0L3_QUISA|nr:BRCT domain-containing protein [Quillaja saponaria]
MGSLGLGFRQPQFSEDFAWLPDCLQQHRIEGCIEHVNKSPFSGKQAFKDLEFSQREVGQGKDADPLSKEEGRYGSCHLLLSGEDSSPVIASSSGDVFNLNLHLSSDIDSLCCPTPNLNASHNLVVSDKVFPFQLVDTPLGFGEKTYSITSCGADERNLVQVSIPETVNSASLKSKTGKVDSVRKCEGKSKTGPVSETLPTAALLEASLRMKQARMEGLEECFQQPIENCEWSDSLSDLNDFSMADAYEDVGLSYSVSNEQHDCGLVISQGMHIPVSENHYGCDNQYNCSKLKIQNANFHDNTTLKQLQVNMDVQLMEYSTLEPLSCKRQKLSDIHKVSGYVHPILHQLVQKNSEVSTMNKTVDLAMVDGEGSTTYLAPDRFRSRWLGGWTDKKELESSPPLKQTDAKRIPNYFVGETSFLSESADVAPDENSFVQKHNTKSGIGSQSSIPFEGIQNQVVEGISHSQDAIRCSSVSLVDPLCSVVPCSISSENASSPAQRDKENDNEKCVSATAEAGVRNTHSTSDQNIGYGLRDGHTMPSVNEEDLGISVPIQIRGEQMPQESGSFNQTCRKQLTSLKTYSMIVPKPVSPLAGGCINYNELFSEECNWGTLVIDHNMGIGCTRSLDKRNFKDILPFSSTSKCMVAKINEENDKAFVNRKSITKTTYERRSCDKKAANESENLVEKSQRKTSPLILNHRTRRRLVACKNSVDDFSGEKHLEVAVPETVSECQQNNSVLNLQSKHTNSHDGHFRVQKRVRFSEAEDQFQQKKNLPKMQSLHQNCPTTRASKRRKYSKSFSNSWAHDKKSYVTNFCKVRKRMIFQGIEFLLSGLSSQNEKSIEGLIRNFGGLVLFDIPLPPISRRKRTSRFSCLKLPVLLCSRKLQTTKFLYACAVNALILKADWVKDCITAGSILQPEKYMIQPNQLNMECSRIGRPVHSSNENLIFDRVGVMLHGKLSFCTKFAAIIKHGGGQVFKTLQWLVQGIHKERISVGAIVAENKNRASRHLKYYASESEIPMMPASWIVKSLHSGRLLPFEEANHTHHKENENQELLCPASPITSNPDISIYISEEI